LVRNGKLDFWISCALLVSPHLIFLVVSVSGWSSSLAILLLAVPILFYFSLPSDNLAVPWICFVELGFRSKSQAPDEICASAFSFLDPPIRSLPGRLVPSHRIVLPRQNFSCRCLRSGAWASVLAQGFFFSILATGVCLGYLTTEAIAQPVSWS
jgi:hypothetical protein